MDVSWYNAFNAVEAILWALVALFILCRVPCANHKQRAAVVLAGVAFLAFGITDLLELGKDGSLPLWLWGRKVACGIGILCARYTWLGWTRFRWRDREVLFGLACLFAVALIVCVQRLLNSPVAN